MKYVLFAVVAMLAFSGVAVADGINVHLEQTIGAGTPADGTHTVDASVGTDGSASLAVDGASVLP